MSYATGTTHYDLPLTVGTDKRDWADTNQAFSDLDAAVYNAVSDVATAGTAIEGLETRMTTAEGNISDNTADITSLDTRMTTAEGAITSLSSRIDDVGNDLGDMICAYNEPTATSTHRYEIDDYFRYNDVLYQATQAIAIGDTIVPDTNCTTTNVTTELLKIKSDIPDTSTLAPKSMLGAVDSSTATASHAKGDIIVVGDVQKFVKNSIAAGDTINSSNTVDYDPIETQLYHSTFTGYLQDALLEASRVLSVYPDKIIRNCKITIASSLYIVQTISSQYIGLTTLIQNPADGSLIARLFTYNRSTDFADRAYQYEIDHSNVVNSGPLSGTSLTDASIDIRI